MSEGIEGPRALRDTEFESLRALTDVVFRPGMPEQYPQLFNAENADDLRVCLADGKCVSHVGMTERHALLFGCRVQVCSIGAVCTHPEYRGRGLASACFDDAVDLAFRDGVDFMKVSGSRSLYRRRGCLRVGQDTSFVLTADDLPAVLKTERPGVTVEEMKEEKLPLLMDCYRREPVRFLRPPGDYHYARQSGMVMNRRTDFLEVGEAGVFRGYLLIQRPHDDKVARLVEFAGDRHALLAALPSLFQRYGVRELHWHVLRHDALFRSLCEGAGLRGTPATTSGTVKLINFPQLMERMRPYWEELLGRQNAAKLAFRQQGEQYGFRFGDDELVTDRDTATWIVFGDVENSASSAIEGQGALSAVLKEILPLPCLWYGINYV